MKQSFCCFEFHFSRQIEYRNETTGDINPLNFVTTLSRARKGQRAKRLQDVPLALNREIANAIIESARNARGAEYSLSCGRLVASL
jgi:hypothetical protein